MPVVKIGSGGDNLICKRYEFRPDVQKEKHTKTFKLQRSEIMVLYDDFVSFIH